MTTMTLNLRRGFILGTLLTLLLVTTGAGAVTATTEVCGDAERQQYLQDVEDGLDAESLEAKYAHCGGVQAEPAAATTLHVTAASKTVDNSIGSIFYEQLNSCGYHPQGELVTCDVEVKRTSWYGPFPSGSNEFVRFCFDCNLDGIYEGNTLGIVHVTNNNFTVNPAPNPSWYFNAYASTWQFCPQNDGREIEVKAVLAWARDPGAASCNQASPRVIWGNQIFFTARRDP